MVSWMVLKQGPLHSIIIIIYIYKIFSVYTDIIDIIVMRKILWKVIILLVVHDL